MLQLLTGNMYNPPGKLNSIQLLRAVAVLLVLYCHVLDLQPDHNSHSISVQQHFFYLQNFGAVGVDIFFAISGFIITIISRDYVVKAKPGYFLLKRFIRIIPMYWLVSFLFMIYSQVIDGRSFDIRAMLKTIFFFPFFDKGIFDFPVLGVGWTLSFEILFYCAVFASMFLNKRWHMQTTMMLLAVIIALNYIIPVNGRFLMFFGNPIIIEFFLGITAGLIFLSPLMARPNVCRYLVLSGIAILVATIFLGYGGISESGNVWNKQVSLLRVCLWGIPSAILLTGIVMFEKTKPFFVPVWMLLLGNASYSIYLTHNLILGVLYGRWIKWGLIEKLSPDLLIIISVALTALAGCAFYQIIELPLLRFLNKKLMTGKIVALK